MALDSAPDRRPRSLRILFATDGSEGAERALDLLCCLPLRRADDEVRVASVAVRPVLALYQEAFSSELDPETVASEIAEAAADRLVRCGITARTSVLEGPVARAIIDAALDTHSDLIVLGSRGRGLIAGALLGSVARALARHSAVPVLVVRDRREAPRRILVTVDGSADSGAAIAMLASLPLPAGAEIVLLHVVAERPPAASDDHVLLEQRERMQAHALVTTASHALPSRISTRIEVRSGPVADRILSVATAIGADLIVLGSRGLELGTGFLQGSTADRVLSGAHCAVLVARAVEKVRAPDRGAHVTVAPAF